MINVNILEKVVVLGTGGTMAGTADSSADNIGYKAAQVSVDQLLEGVSGLPGMLAGRVLVSEQVAQIDSKDMSFAVWQKLAARIQFHLAQSDVVGVVVTHGTDTLEETAYFLHLATSPQCLACKPIVLTCAMRPSSSAAPDGPQNLLDAISVATTAGAHGVIVVCAGTIHGAVDVQKAHTYRLDAFDSGDAGPVGYVEEGSVRLVKNWPSAPSESTDLSVKAAGNFGIWPRVEIVMNYAGACGAMVDAIISPAVSSPGVGPVQGLVVAGTGNGTVHQDLEAALIRAHLAGVTVLRASRCTRGRVLPTPGSAIPDSAGLSPVKARVALMLALL